jgi:hypothetical protein
MNETILNYVKIFKERVKLCITTLKRNVEGRKGMGRMKEAMSYAEKEYVSG